MLFSAVLFVGCCECSPRLTIPTVDVIAFNTTDEDSFSLADLETLYIHKIDSLIGDTQLIKDKFWILNRFPLRPDDLQIERGRYYYQVLIQDSVYATIDNVVFRSFGGGGVFCSCPNVSVETLDINNSTFTLNQVPVVLNK
jgi:hypothetical protein